MIPLLLPLRSALLLLMPWFAAWACWVGVPEVQERLQAEDGVIEWAAAALFLASAVAGAARWLRHRCRPRLHGLLPLLGLVAFLDEISFGMRLIGFEAPKVHWVRIDGVHDLLDLVWQLANRHLPGAVVVLGVAAAIGVAIALLFAGRRLLGRLIREHEPMAPALLAAALVVVAQSIDLVAHQATPLALVEELLETSAAQLWLLAALRVGRVRPGAAELRGEA